MDEMLKNVKSLAMLKMEKILRAIDKGYSRFPYLQYDYEFLLNRVKQELKELEDAFNCGLYSEMRVEIADLINILEYLFERTFIEESEQKKKSEEAFRRFGEGLFE